MRPVIRPHHLAHHDAVLVIPVEPPGRRALDDPGAELARLGSGLECDTDLLGDGDVRGAIGSPIVIPSRGRGPHREVSGNEPRSAAGGSAVTRQLRLWPSP